ncbi:hypothetical protein SAMN00790413_00724 [Deinococcus hopiensis KR-140]|uniref:Uncharacterized protein n=1 Tax=Deinococcus hopiensis KR-140 TaxID=695939 RepID=A0A1W1VAI2_9DEIO|nr:hypothetical protein SAMN00790413_00724 [Deinococcus hopiensis KR-140]
MRTYAGINNPLAFSDRNLPVMRFVCRDTGITGHKDNDEGADRARAARSALCPPGNYRSRRLKRHIAKPTASRAYTPDHSSRVGRIGVLPKRGLAPRATSPMLRRADGWR